MGISAKLKASNYAKTNNHAAAMAAKVKLRELVLEAVGPSAVVFDAFAGDGAMWRAVWRKAHGYLGCDLEWYRDERLAFAADNRRVLRAIDLSPFTLFDLDAWGSPWEQALIVAARRPVKPRERIGLVLTEGSSLKLKMGGVPIALRVMARLRGEPAGGGRSHAGLIERALAGLCERMGVKLLRRWQAQGRTGAAVAYIGLLAEGLPARARKVKAETVRAPAPGDGVPMAAEIMPG
ncbi:MAG: hypothetical protein ACREEN_00380 [Stellaceae bacterium]